MGSATQIKGMYASQVRFVRRVGIVGEWQDTDSPDIFTVEGGSIRVVVFYGIVTATFEAAATQLQPRITPVAGAAATQVLSNACATLSAAAINTTIVPAGPVAGACTIETTLGVTVGNMATNEWILLPGVIDILVSGADNADGAMDFCMGYLPLEIGAVVTPL